MFDAAFIAFRLVFRYAHTGERADNAAERAQRTGSGQRSHDGPGRDERTDTRNGKESDTCQPSEHAAGDSPGSGARGCSFGCLRILLMRKILGAGIVRKQRGNVRVPEVGAPESVYSLFRGIACMVNPENGSILS